MRIKWVEIGALESSSSSLGCKSGSAAKPWCLICRSWGAERNGLSIWENTCAERHDIRRGAPSIIFRSISSSPGGWRSVDCRIHGCGIEDLLANTGGARLTRIRRIHARVNLRKRCRRCEWQVWRVAAHAESARYPVPGNLASVRYLFGATRATGRRPGRGAPNGVVRATTSHSMGLTATRLGLLGEGRSRLPLPGCAPVYAHKLQRAIAVGRGGWHRQYMRMPRIGGNKGTPVGRAKRATIDYAMRSSSSPRKSLRPPTRR